MVDHWLIRIEADRRWKTDRKGVHCFAVAELKIHRASEAQSSGKIRVRKHKVNFRCKMWEGKGGKGKVVSRTFEGNQQRINMYQPQQPTIFQGGPGFPLPVASLAARLRLRAPGVRTCRTCRTCMTFVRSEAWHEDVTNTEIKSKSMYYMTFMTFRLFLCVIIIIILSCGTLLWSVNSVTIMICIICICDRNTIISYRSYNILR